MNGSVRPRTATLLATGFGALALATALSACGPSTSATGSGGATVPVTVNSSAAASMPAAPSGTAGPTGSATGVTASAPSSAPSPTSVVGGITSTPKQQLSAVPPGAKLTPFLSASAGSDGRTLEVELESMGGACGEYDVVLQQSSTAVQVGLVHLPASGHICPMYVGPLRIAVQLSAPLAGRPVVDLANGQRLNVG
jgi:hypothetical protein